MRHKVKIKYDKINFRKNSIETFFTSEKLSKSFIIKTIKEYLFVFFMEFISDVVSYQYQPKPILYFLEGKKRDYTADYLVETTSDNYIFEIKLHKHLINNYRTYKKEFKIISQELEQLGYKFRLITNKTIEKQPRLENLKILRYYSRYRFNQNDYFTIKSILETNNGELDLETLADSCIKTNVERNAIYALLFHKRLFFNLNHDLAKNPTILLKGDYQFDDIFETESCLSYHFNSEPQT